MSDVTASRQADQPASSQAAAGRPEPDGVCVKCGAVATGTMADGQCGACLLEMTLGFADQSDTDADVPPEGRRFGPYSLVRELGRGGMGVVWKAWDPRLRRHVALKLLIGGAFAGREFARRFQDEAALAARLSHPGLVAIHEAGEAEGQSYFTMEWIDGRSLAEIARNKPLPAETTAQWLRAVAEAVGYAHDQGVLHRDLKPSNILIDDRGHPRVADFGLAKLRDALPEMTRSAETAGSPPYMAPEQVAKTNDPPGVAMDVYALGAVLYHLLTGRPPFQGETVAQVLAQVAEAPPVPPHRLLPAVPRDLETICLKCLEKEPSRRYATAHDLAEDLGRFLDGRPVKARPVSAIEKAWRWARRKPVLASLAAALVASWAAGTVLVLRQAAENRRTADHLADEQYALSLSVAARTFLGNDPELAPGDLTETRRALEEAQPKPGQRDRRGFEWRWLWHASESHARHRLTGHTGYIATAATSPDGRWLATSGFDNQTILWDLNVDPPVPRSFAPVFSESLAFDADGTSIFMIGASADGQPLVQRRSLADGAVTESLFPARQFSLSADGRRMATLPVTGLFFSANQLGPVRIWDVKTRQPLWEAAPARNSALSADGRWLATGDLAGAVRWWDVDSRRELAHWPADSRTAGAVHHLSFAPDGSRLVASSSMAARVWKLSATTPSDSRALVLDHPDSHDVLSATFSEDGDRIATVCTDHTVRLWTDLDKEEPHGHLLRGHADEVWCSAWRRGADAFISAGKDREVLVWSAQPPPADITLPDSSWRPPLFSPDSQWLLTEIGGAQQTRAALWRIDGHIMREFPTGLQSIQFCDNGRTVLLRNLRDPALEWWPLTASSASRRLPMPELADVHAGYQTGLTRDGRAAFVVTRLGALVLHDLTTGNETARWQVTGPDPGLIRAVTWSPDGTVVAIGTDRAPYSVWLCNPATGRVTGLEGHRDQINDLAFSPDGRLLASASTDHDVRIWDMTTLRCLRTLPAHPRTANGLCFSPEDGRTLVTIGYRQSIKFWHTTTWRELASLSLTTAGHHVSFSPDGSRLAIELHQPSPTSPGPATHLRLIVGEKATLMNR